MKRNGVLLWVVLVMCTIAGLVTPQSTLSAEKPKDYPNKTVSIWQGFAPGGANDVGSRMVAESLKKVIGVPVITESKPGAGQQVMLTDFINNTKPDGYVMVYVSVPQMQSVVYDSTRQIGRAHV